MGLAFDVGGGGIVLRVERVELLVETVLGGDTGIDRTADGFDGVSLHHQTSVADRSSLSLRPKKRGPFHLVPVITCQRERRPLRSIPRTGAISSAAEGVH